jgi:Fe-S-cluster containining protein
VPNTIAIHDQDQIDKSSCQNREFVDISIPIADSSLDVTLSCTDKPVSLSELVPICRKLADMIIEKVIQHRQKTAPPTACKKGCSPCCHYMIPLSPAESFRLHEEIQQMPRDRKRKAIRSMLLAARRVLEYRVPRLAAEGQHSEELQTPNLEMISDWYDSFHLPCPFLTDNACSIYANRPIACREYMVTGNPLGCKTTSNKTVSIIEMPVSIAEVLNKVSNRLEGTQTESVILPVSIVWCNENMPRAEKTYPAKTLVNTLSDCLQAAIDKKTRTTIRSRLYHSA